MTCFLTNLTRLTFLTAPLTFLTAKCLKNYRAFVRFVRFSDIFDCACGEKTNFSLSFSRVPPRARVSRFVRNSSPFCQKLLALTQRVPADPEPAEALAKFARMRRARKEDTWLSKPPWCARGASAGAP